MKKITRLKDLAEGLGVSITTVSKALNDHPDISAKRKKEILDYAKSVNYVPNQVARSFRQQKTKMIGIIISDNADPFYARVIRGIEETLSVLGYYCVVMNSHEDVEQEIKLIDELLGLNVAGVILAPAAGNKRSCELLRKYDIPYVLVNRYLEEDKDTYVVLDDYQAAYMTAKHLCSYGNDKIFFLNFLPSVSSAQNRLEGYKKALEESGIPYQPSLVVSGCTNQTDGYESMKRILEKNKPPFCVMCYSDYIAIGAICAVQERGFNLPHDVALCGNDDISILSFVKPRLTTIGAPKLRMGIASAELLIELMEAKKKIDKSGDGNEEVHVSEPRKGKHIVMKPEMILRETS